MSNKVKLTREEQTLLERALEAMRYAHVIWGFPVGAAVLGEDNLDYIGCNVESDVSGLGICAERCAIDHAVLHGNRRIRKIAITSESKAVRGLRPCGACLQYVKDFSQGDVKIITATSKDGRILPESVDRRTIREMLPLPFEIDLGLKLSQIAKKFEIAGIPWVVVSGAAVHLWTSRREITDVDILVPEEDVPKVGVLFDTEGKSWKAPRGTSFGVALRGFHIVGKVMVDEECRFVMDEEIVRRACPKKLFNIEVRVASVEDNIALKAMLQRGPDVGKRDKDDILLLKETHRDIDLQYLRRRLEVCNAVERTHAFLRSCGISI